VEQLAPGRGKTKRAYLWAWRSNALGSDPQIVYVDDQPGRGGQYAVEFLAGWEGSLMVDDYAGDQILFRGQIVERACMAHARRKFFDLHEANGSPIAAEALRRIGELYAIEAKMQGKSIEERARRRKEAGQPRLEARVGPLDAYTKFLKPTPSLPTSGSVTEIAKAKRSCA